MAAQQRDVPGAALGHPACHQQPQPAETASDQVGGVGTETDGGCVGRWSAGQSARAPRTSAPGGLIFTIVGVDCGEKLSMSVSSVEPASRSIRPPKRLGCSSEKTRPRPHSGSCQRALAPCVRPSIARLASPARRDRQSRRSRCGQASAVRSSRRLRRRVPHRRSGRHRVRRLQAPEVHPVRRPASMPHRWARRDRDRAVTTPRHPLRKRVRHRLRPAHEGPAFGRDGRARDDQRLLPPAALAGPSSGTAATSVRTELAQQPRATRRAR